MTEAITASTLTFTLVILAEIGDKSQLVCMALAAQFRGRPVFFGAVVAFVVLNLLAVVFGAALANWIPTQWLAIGVAILFALFGVKALLDAGEEAPEKPQAGARSLFFTSFSMIFLAEFGDKTQIAVAGLATQQPVVAVWLGSTLALIATTGLGVFAGRTLLRKMPLHWLHRASGVFFLLMAAFSLSSLWWR